jgi:hypothetical protein
MKNENGMRGRLQDFDSDGRRRRKKLPIPSRSSSRTFVICPKTETFTDQRETFFETYYRERRPRFPLDLALLFTVDHILKLNFNLGPQTHHGNKRKALRAMEEALAAEPAHTSPVMRPQIQQRQHLQFLRHIDLSRYTLHILSHDPHQVVGLPQWLSYRHPRHHHQELRPSIHIDGTHTIGAGILHLK